MADPYVYEGSTVLKNLAGIKDQNKLDEFESTVVQLALVKLYKERIETSSAKSIFLIHKALFENNDDIIRNAKKLMEQYASDKWANIILAIYKELNPRKEAGNAD